MAQLYDIQDDLRVAWQRTISVSLGKAIRAYRWPIGFAIVALALLVSVLVWGAEMGFPTTVSSQTSSDGLVTLDRTVRDVTSKGIDDAVQWMTTEGAWVFDGLSTAVTFALIRIEGALKWMPWPVIVIGLALLAFAIGKWSLLLFTALALLFIGFMDLWANTMDTVALMVVAVAVAVAVGLPLGVLGARNNLANNLMRPILD
ncbi:MAG: hypothetical protein OXS35_04035, partial [Dehalococcoidia bacterium]|nr:hypothetical protein [Dehalococcoidia bacterium]